MTAIPGTQTPKGPPASPSATAGPQPLQPIVNTQSSVSATPLEMMPTVTTDPTEIPWFLTRNAWMAFGSILGILSAVVGLFHASFFYLAPLCPTIGVIAWYARAFFNKYEKKVDAFQ